MSAIDGRSSLYNVYRDRSDSVAKTVIEWATPMVSVDNRPLPLCAEQFEDGKHEITAHFKFIAVKAADDTWAAYYGPSHWTNSQVESSGEKMPRDGARRLFPNISERYRD